MSAFRALRQWAAASTVAHVGFAFIVMGGWAVFANRDHALPQMLLAGVVQGTISALLTLGLKKFLEWLSARLTLRQAQRDVSLAKEEKRQPEPVEGGEGLVSLAVPPLVTAASILAILFAAHTLAGTPEIWTTIAFPFTVSTSYAAIYNWGLWRRTNG